MKQKKFVDVILTDAEGSLGQLVQDNLNKFGVSTLVMNSSSAGKDVPGFLRTLHHTLDEYDARMIIPVFFPEVLSLHRSEFPGIVIPVDNASNIELLDNKRSACELAARLGIPQPRQYASVEEVEFYPVVFKRTKGQGGDSVYFPCSRKALENLISNSSDYLITDFISGHNFCVDVLRTSHYFRASVYRVLAPEGKGVSTLRKTVNMPILVDYARKMLDEIDYQGVCGFDFRVSDANDNNVFFLECNPRFSGGLQTAIETGFEIPYLLWSLYTKQ